MATEHDQFVCLRAYCGERPTDPVCDTEMSEGPVRPPTAKTAAKKTPTTKTKAKTTPAASKKPDADEVLDPFGASTKPAPKRVTPSTTTRPPPCDTCIERPD
jgi:hypothetical protein